MALEREVKARKLEEVKKEVSELCAQISPTST